MRTEEEQPGVGGEGRCCRICGSVLSVPFVDLGLSPLANQFVKAEQAGQPSIFYPLKAWVCGQCFLVQLDAFTTPEHIFGEYAYFSSFSDSWLAHAQAYSKLLGKHLEAKWTSGGRASRPLVVEVACNDGYLLQYFREAGFETLGIEPARNVAETARSKGIPVIADFFGVNLAEQLTEEGKQADLLIANNVLAHVPDLHDFVGGLARLLKPDGVLTLEFPHLLKLMKHDLFDTIYHEHFSYFSLYTVQKLFEGHGLAVYDVEQLDTHGGSLRIYAGHTSGKAALPASSRMLQLLSEEQEAGILSLEAYRDFAKRVAERKRSIWQFLIAHKQAGKKIVAYGAPAKGNTLLNYCGIGPDLIDYTVDRNPYKQGLLLPGSLIPVYPPEKLHETKPDIVVILPWNVKEEIAGQLAYIKEWGGHLAVWLPQMEVW